MSRFNLRDIRDIRPMGLIGAALALALVTSACNDDKPFARAYRATSPDQLIGGDVAMARVGDFIIENDKIRVAVLDKDSSPAPGVFGGTLVDADLQRPEAANRNGVGRDQLAEVIPVVNLLWPRPDEGDVTIINDGSDGNAAIVRVTGEAGVFLEALSILRGELLALLFPGVRFDFRIETDYILEPGKPWVKIRSTAYRTDADAPNPVGEALPMPSIDATIPIFQAILGSEDLGLKPGIMAGDFLFFGARNDIFAPGLGFDEEKAIFDALFAGQDTFTNPLTYDYMAAAGGVVSYGYFNLGTGGGDPQVLVPIITSSSTGFVTAAKNCLVAADDDDTCDRFAAFTWERYLVVGSGDIASVGDAIYEAREVPTGKVRGVVVGGQGEVVPNAHVFVMTDPDPTAALTDVYALADANVVASGAPGLVTMIDADVGLDPIEDGDFAASLPAGNYVVFAQNEHRSSTGPLQRITITPGETVVVNPVVPPPARVRVRVVDQGNQLVDAKVAFIPIVDGKRVEGDGLRRPWMGEGRLGNGVRHFTAHIADEVVTELEAGTYDVVASRGPEWSIGESRITVTSGRETVVSLALRHEVDTAGWISGDFHLHAEASFDSGMVFEERVRRILIEGLDVAIATDHDVITDYAPAVRNLGAQDRLTTGIGVELSTLELGHFVAFPLRYDQTQIPDHGAPDWTCLNGPQIMSLLNDTIVDPKGGVRIMAHPRDGFIGHISQIGLDQLGEARELSLLEAENVLLARTTCDIDAMEVFNSKRFDLVRTPTNREVILYNRCYARIDAAADTAALDLACPELSPEGPLATCRANERLADCKQHHRRRLAFLSARDILTRTPDEQVAIWNHTPTATDEDACDPGEFPDAIPDAIATLPCVHHPGTYDDWMRWLEGGLEIAITGASDSHGSEREPGAPRTFVKVDAEPGAIDVGEAARAIKDGKAVASHGPFIDAKVNGRGPGSLTAVSGGTFELALRVETASWFGVDRIEIYVAGRLEEVIELDHGPTPIVDYNGVIELPTPADDSFVSVVALGTREENLMGPVIFDVFFGELQLPRVASLAFSAIPAFSLIFTPTPTIPDFFPVFPMAITNAIRLDVNGDGEWDPPNPRPSFCERTCDPSGANTCEGANEICLPSGFCGLSIPGTCETGPPGTGIRHSPLSSCH